VVWVVLAVVAGGLVVVAVCVVEPFEEEPHPAISEHIARVSASPTIGFLASLRIVLPLACLGNT
jgi:hypothetical protein